MPTVKGHRLRVDHEQDFDVSEVFRDVVENDVKYVLAYTTITKNGPGVHVLDEYGDGYVAHCEEELDRLLMLHEVSWSIQE